MPCQVGSNLTKNPTNAAGFDTVITFEVPVSLKKNLMFWPVVVWDDELG